MQSVPITAEPEGLRPRRQQFVADNRLTTAVSGGIRHCREGCQWAAVQMRYSTLSVQRHYRKVAMPEQRCQWEPLPGGWQVRAHWICVRLRRDHRRHQRQQAAVQRSGD